MIIELNILYFIFWDLKVVFSSTVTNYYQVSMETIIFWIDFSFVFNICSFENNLKNKFVFYANFYFLEFLFCSIAKIC